MKKTYTKKQISEAISYWKKQLKKMNESDDGNYYGYMHQPLKIIFSDNKPDIEIMWSDDSDSNAKYSFITDAVFEYKKNIENILSHDSGCKCEVVSLEKDHYDHEYIVGLKVSDLNEFKEFADENGMTL